MERKILAEAEYNEEVEGLRTSSTEGKPKMPDLRERYNTGPKGVLADYAEHQQIQKTKRLQHQFELANEGRKLFDGDDGNEVETREEYLQHIRKEYDDLQTQSDDEDEDEFMKEWKRKRLQQLRDEASRPTFGSVYRVNDETFVDAVEKVPSDVVVVVHLFQNHVPACVRLNQFLSTLACNYPTVKFLRIVATEAKESFDDAGLPAILMYKGGDLQTSIVPVTEEIGFKFTCEAVEEMLQKREFAYELLDDVFF